MCNNYKFQVGCCVWKDLLYWNFIICRSRCPAEQRWFMPARFWVCACARDDGLTPLNGLGSFCRQWSMPSLPRNTLLKETIEFLFPIPKFVRGCLCVSTNYMTRSCSSQAIDSRIRTHTLADDMQIKPQPTLQTWRVNMSVGKNVWCLEQIIISLVPCSVAYIQQLHTFRNFCWYLYFNVSIIRYVCGANRRTWKPHIYLHP